MRVSSLYRAWWGAPARLDRERVRHPPELVDRVNVIVVIPNLDRSLVMWLLLYGHTHTHIIIIYVGRELYAQFIGYGEGS